MTTVKGGVQLRAGEGCLTLGFSKVIKGTQELSFAVTRAFSKKVTGPNPLEVPGLQSIELEMDQWDFELGWSFGIRR